MEFQDINTKDPTKRKVETNGTESSSEEEKSHDQGGDILSGRHSTYLRIRLTQSCSPKTSSRTRLRLQGVNLRQYRVAQD